ncbi:MAG: hypothetical protein U1D69_01945 [Polynucleobacter sp.]|nr:hypothetical protein [Polynucleobacter sp.]
MKRRSKSIIAITGLMVAAGAAYGGYTYWSAKPLRTAEAIMRGLSNDPASLQFTEHTTCRTSDGKAWFVFGRYTQKNEVGGATPLSWFVVKSINGQYETALGKPGEQDFATFVGSRFPEPVDRVENPRSCKTYYLASNEWARKGYSVFDETDAEQAGSFEMLSNNVDDYQ